jgi:hemolysin III
LEERINVISHAVGIFLGLLASMLLVRRAILIGDAWHLVSFSVFGLSMVTLYSASTFYHNASNIDWRRRLRILDHAAIYLLIAGTYTPFALVTLRGTTGWIIFGLIWTFALIGIVLKIFFTGRYDRVSTAMYLFMGWLVVVYLKPLIHNLPPEGLGWLLAGGIAYTIGAVLYSVKKIKFNHAIFHFFVLAGNICHFISIYYYVLPGK